MNPEFNPKNNFHKFQDFQNFSAKQNQKPRLQQMKKPLMPEGNAYKLNRISVNLIPISLEFIHLRNISSPYFLFISTLSMFMLSHCF